MTSCLALCPGFAIPYSTPVCVFHELVVRGQNRSTYMQVSTRCRCKGRATALGHCRRQRHCFFSCKTVFGTIIGLVVWHSLPGCALRDLFAEGSFDFGAVHFCGTVFGEVLLGRLKGGRHPSSYHGWLYPVSSYIFFLFSCFTE